MRKFNVNVNGNVYSVEVKEITDGAVAAPVVQPAPVAAAPAGGANVTAPMPGTVLNVVAPVGTAVKAGDVILILEAMKMENDIVAPQDGTIASINASTGDSVESGTVLATLN